VNFPWLDGPSADLLSLGISTRFLFFPVGEQADVAEMP